MTPHLTCLSCKATSPAGARFCMRCGKLFPVPSEPWPLAKWIGLGIALTTLLAIVTVSTYFKPPKTVSTTPKPRPTVDSARAIEKLRAKVMSVPESRRIFLSIESGSVQGVARVQVSNAWFNSRPHQRRQLTQMLANLWQQEMGEDAAILHVYDISGREVAGTRVLGGVWIEDE